MIMVQRGSGQRRPGSQSRRSAAIRSEEDADDVTDEVHKDGLYNAFVHLGLI